MTAGMVLCMYRLKLGFLSSFVEDLCAISTLFSLEHHPVVFVIELVLVKYVEKFKIGYMKSNETTFYNATTCKFVSVQGAIMLT